MKDILLEKVNKKTILFQKIFEKENNEYIKYSKLYNKYVDEKINIDRRIKRLYKISPFENDKLTENYFMYIKRNYLEKIFRKSMDKIEKNLDKNIKCMYGSLIDEIKKFTCIIRNNIIEQIVIMDENNLFIMKVCNEQIIDLTKKLVMNGISYEDEYTKNVDNIN